MPAYDPRIDAYLEKSAAFARPVLAHVRELIHEVCPEVEESLKWGMPSFGYKGVLCGFAAFKAHCTFGFWKAALMADPQGVMANKEATAMGSFGRITSGTDLPSDKILKALIKDAMRLNEDGIKLPVENRKPLGTKPPIATPEFVAEALSKNEAAKEHWEKFAPSHRREYLEWIAEAKTETTREKRLVRMIEQISEGKQRHWKYQ